MKEYSYKKRLGDIASSFGVLVFGGFLLFIGRFFENNFAHYGVMIIGGLLILLVLLMGKGDLKSYLSNNVIQIGEDYFSYPDGFAYGQVYYKDIKDVLEVKYDGVRDFQVRTKKGQNLRFDIDEFKNTTEYVDCLMKLKKKVEKYNQG